MKKFLLIFFLGFIIIPFSTIFKKDVEFAFTSMSVLSFLSALFLQIIKIKFYKKLISFTLFYVIFKIIDIFFSGVDSFFFHLQDIIAVVLMFSLGSFINLKAFSKKSFFIILLAVSFIFLQMKYTDDISYKIDNYTKINNQIPDFKLEDLNGSTITKKDFKGKVVFFDFWTTTCGYCIAQFPSIYKVAENFKDNPNVLFYLIDYNGKFDDAEYVKKFVKQRNIRLPVLIDKSSELSKKMNCLAFPHSFILDKNLNIRYHHAGYNKTTEKNYIVDVTNRIKELLNE